MKIHTTAHGHVIETENKKRPFRICKNGRFVSFSTVEAAEAALISSHAAAVEQARIIQASAANQVSGAA